MDKLDKKLESWWLVEVAGFNGGLKLLIISFFLSFTFLVINQFFKLDWQGYFRQPLCH